MNIKVKYPDHISTIEELIRSPSWEYVQAFSIAMEDKLAIRRYHGGREVWVEESYSKLKAGLRRELDELEQALEAGDEKDILWEAVDVANRALMIADKAGLMKRDA